MISKQSANNIIGNKIKLRMKQTTASLLKLQTVEEDLALVS